MQFIKKPFLIATLLFHSLTTSIVRADELPSSQPLELRLQLIGQETHPPDQLHHLFDLYWDWYLTEDPDEAVILGYTQFSPSWPNWSPEALQRRLSFTNQLADLLHSIPLSHLSPQDQANYHIFKQILEKSQTDAQFGEQYLLINQMFGLHLYPAFLIDLMPTHSLEHYQAILSRLRQTPLFFEQGIAQLEIGIKKGITPPRVALLSVPQQILNQLVENPLESSFLNVFKQFPASIDQETQIQLQKEAVNIYLSSIVPAFQHLYSYITDHYLPACRTTTAFEDLPQGKKWYAHQIASHTTSSLNAQEVHQLGLQEVNRIFQEMQTIIASTGFDGAFEEFLHYMRTDPQFFYSTREELLEGYRLLTRHIETKLPLLFSQLPKQPFEVIPVPPYSEESQTGAYYSPGSLAQQRPGYFFINTSFPEKRPKWEMEPLALHEAVPGHHLQLALADEIEHLPLFRKHTHFTAYIEGWGLYAESLGTELGLYQDPYAKFGRLTYEMLRAIRLVVDTGLHSLHWSREEAIQFFKKYVSLTDHEIQTEVDRYLVMPGQALAYKVGEIKIQSLRQTAQQQLGEQFDIRAFHHCFLQNGALPLDLAEHYIKQWIEQHVIEK